MYPLDDTIAAIASPPGGAAHGIVRISGPEALDCLMRFFKPKGSPLPLGEGNKQMCYPHAVAGTLHLPKLHSPLPCEAYIWATALDGNVRSYTGQPVAEIHTLGSPPLLQLVLQSLCAAGARLAGPGEFTLRAFLAGRIDLTQAEAVLGVIDAGDSRELTVALAQLAGGLAHPLHRLRNSLVDLLACVEAGFDFADEDLTFITCHELDGRLAEVEKGIAAIHRQTAARGEAADAIVAVLVGRPNTGKSSLFNVLAGRHAALVSDRPGTTRDYLTADLDLDGVKCRLVDTAGMRGKGREERGERREDGVRENAPRLRSRGIHDDESIENSIERAAHSAATLQRRQAHVQVLCLDATRPLDSWEQEELANPAERLQIVVLTKCDAVRGTDCTHIAFETSSVTGYGIAKLRTELRRQTLAAGGTDGDVVAGTAVRCDESLRLAGQCIQRARQVASAGQEELAAAEIRSALDAIGKVVGAVYTEDVLDHIFSRFCVGK